MAEVATAATDTRRGSHPARFGSRRTAAGWSRCPPLFAHFPECERRVVYARGSRRISRTQPPCLVTKRPSRRRIDDCLHHGTLRVRASFAWRLDLCAWANPMTSAPERTILLYSIISYYIILCRIISYYILLFGISLQTYLFFCLLLFGYISFCARENCPLSD